MFLTLWRLLGLLRQDELHLSLGSGNELYTLQNIAASMALYCNYLWVPDKGLEGRGGSLPLSLTSALEELCIHG